MKKRKKMFSLLKILENIISKSIIQNTCDTKSYAVSKKTHRIYSVPLILYLESHYRKLKLSWNPISPNSPTKNSKIIGLDWYLILLYHHYHHPLNGLIWSWINKYVNTDYSHFHLHRLYHWLVECRVFLKRSLRCWNTMLVLWVLLRWWWLRLCIGGKLRINVRWLWVCFWTIFLRWCMRKVRIIVLILYDSISFFIFVLLSFLVQHQDYPFRNFKIISYLLRLFRTLLHTTTHLSSIPRIRPVERDFSSKAVGRGGLFGTGFVKGFGRIVMLGKGVWVVKGMFIAVYIKCGRIVNVF